MKLKILALGLLFVASVPAADWFPVRLEALRYPPLGYQARIEGMVRLRLTLDERGEVSHVDIVSGHPVLARAAEDNIKLWSFTILCKNSDHPSRTIEFTYDFRLDGTVASNPNTRFRYEHPYRVVAISPALRWTPSLQTKPR